ncbi:MAG: hypothetical protein K2N38_02330 [Oscillospiraceae bacterium]|nr:hypothetical protein [Oscillospiraceae bacterium]
MKVKLSVDTHCIKDTPKANIPYGVISKTIGKNPRELSLEEVAEVIENGYTISSSIFQNGIRKKENIIEMQLFILDFDGKNDCELAYAEALKRADDYDLPVVISYETKSSVNWSRYRLIFLYNEPVKDMRLMDIINRLLLHIFPEADQTTKDLSKIFLPGSNVRFHSGKTFHLDTLIVATRNYCLNKSKCSKSTWVDLLKKFSTVYGLAITGMDIFISDNINPPELHTFEFQSIYFYMENNSKVCKSDRVKHLYFLDTVKDKDTKIKLTKTTEPLQLRKLSSIKDECPLMYDFENGIRLPHEQWFGLATNLINIKGGQGQFAAIINEYSDRYGNAEFKIEQMKYAARMNYKPQSCAGFCPYSDECPHLKNMILTLKNKRHRMKRIAGYSERFVALDSVRKDMQSFFNNAVSNEFAVNILKAPTGSGKSFAHLEFLKSFNRRTINAYPNSALMLEKYNTAKQMGINAAHTPVIEDLYQHLTTQQYEQIISLYEIGAGELPIRLLKQWSKDNSYIQAYLSKLNNLPADAHIFTTHSRLFRMSEQMIGNAVVFIDEDIFPSMFGCSAVSVDEFYKLYNAVDDELLKNKLSRVKEHISGDSHYFHLGELRFPAEYKSEFMARCTNCGIVFSQNIWGLAESENFYYCATDHSIRFTVVNRLEHFGKIIMMSATANERICWKAFNTSVNFCDLGQIEYKGKVIMHSSKSFSRAYLSDNNAEKTITDIVAKHGDCVYITFKEYCKYIDSKYQRTHYGQAVGTNDFEGRDLVIIGLNHRPSYVYVLFARSLGMDNYDILSTRTAQLHGFEFSMMTYADSELRNIQQYMLGSDLEQAIGRARLIYHDCTVHLYGNFPARQGLLENEVECSITS